MKKIIFFCVFCGVFVFCGSESAPADQKDPVISRIEIVIIGRPGDETLTNMARGLILMKEGEPFSDEKLVKSIELLTQSKMFKKIDVPDPDWKQPEPVLSFVLTPFQRVKDIQIKGGFPMFEREILNAMTLYIGESLNTENFSKQEEAIAEIFLNEGYLSPQVRVTYQEDPADGNCIVYVNIEKENYLKVDRVDIEGNHSFSSTRLKIRMKTWHSSLLFGGAKRFVQKKLDEDVKSLIQFYRGKGYADAVVKADVQKDTENLKTVVLIHVEEGPQYDVGFDGNTEFWGITLKKDLTLFDKGNANNLGLRKSVRNIRDRYRAAGYEKSLIEAEDETAEDRTNAFRDIRIRIQEGPRSVVDFVEIAGNQAFSDDDIRGQILTRLPGWIADGEFVPEILEEDKQAIESLYARQGYLNAVVKDHVTWREDEKTGNRLAGVTIEIEEGPQTIVSSVKFKGLTVLDPEDAAKSIVLKKGEPFQESMIQSDENTLAALISEKGHPHVTVRGSVDINENETRTDITYTVDEGPYVEMGEIWFAGNFRTQDRIIRNEIELDPGHPFSLRRMLESQKNIRNINALNSVYVKPLGLKENAAQVNLLVEVEEKKPYFFEIGGGYDTARNIFIHARGGDRNLLGQNLETWIGGEYSQIGYRAEAGITEPRLMGSRISSSFTAFMQDQEEFNQDFGTETLGASLLFNRKFWEYFTAGLGFKYESRDQYRTDDLPIPADEVEEYEPRTVFVVSPSMTYNSTDSFVRPRKGIYVSAGVDISNGIDNTVDDFFKYHVETRYYHTPFKRLTLALRARYGFIDPFEADSSVPEDQLFFLGGTADVRGFEENNLRFNALQESVGGREEILGTIEARIDVGGNFEVITFVDSGAIREADASEGLDDFRFSAGLGLNYITPIGPVGLTYGHKLNPETGEDAGRFHFMIGYTF
jgi:outer membrane protein insertion porin family